MPKTKKNPGTTLSPANAILAGETVALSRAEAVALSAEERRSILSAIVATTILAAGDAYLSDETSSRARRVAASTLGGIAADYYGATDPIYYRAIGAANPIVVANPTTKKGETSAAFVAALAKRREAGGRLSRYDVLAASASAGLGRKVSEAETKRLLARKIDLDASYSGRGTRVASPAARPE